MLRSSAYRPPMFAIRVPAHCRRRGTRLREVGLVVFVLRRQWRPSVFRLEVLEGREGAELCGLGGRSLRLEGLGRGVLQDEVASVPQAPDALHVDVRQPAALPQAAQGMGRHQPRRVRWLPDEGAEPSHIAGISVLAAGGERRG